MSRKKFKIMKKLLFLLLCSMYGLPMLTAQNQMAIEGTNWIIKAYKDEMPHHHAFTVRGDTLIDGTWYKKVYYKRIQGQSNHYQLEPPYIVEGEYLFGALRDDALSARTYSIQFTEYEWASNLCALYEEHLLYDFSLAADDTTPECMWANPAHPVVIDAVVEEFLWGADRTVQYFTTNAWDTTRFMGGVGTDMGPFTQAHQSVFVTGAGMELVDYCIGTDVACNFTPLSVYYHGEEMQVGVFPNPVHEGAVTLSLGSLSGLHGLRAQLTHIAGQHAGTWALGQGDTHTLQLGHFAAGTYTLSILDSKGKVAYRTKLTILH